MAIKDDILSAANTSLPVHEVRDSGWRGPDNKPITVYVRELSGLERGLMYASYERFREMVGVEEDDDQYHDAYVLAWCLMEDADGRKRIFADSDVLALCKTHGKIITKLARFAGKVNGMGRYAEEVLPFRAEEKPRTDDVASSSGAPELHGAGGAVADQQS